ncbi:hypothetical protein, conserved [Trypanosoma brucei brucei TREU927]|uniref:FYVE-type domain-containing protein n=1 Tax=Trypanosoma brucei brucei (strain 927/4 GUTat10.1) TaxID=185431 RepID=Q38DV9_TRYB2|nr:hypothetical protein, conserved [Trypanosoma brucei brucei TREU927]EAN77011.1 hypothetical protein, conserved [Trypanosoma brucei brucei TREU927]
MALLEHVSVMDMAKIYSEMATDHHAEKIWGELRAALQERRERSERRKAELLRQQREREEEEELRRQQEAEEERRQQEEEERRQREEEEERERRREERRKRREEELAAEEAAALAEQEAAEEAAALAREEERRQKEERRRLRREARERERQLRAEEEALAAEEARRKEERKSQKAAWEEYVASHPLEFCEVKQTIEQKKVQHTAKGPSQVNKDLFNRIYAPKCPECGTKFSLPPSLWECTVCFRQKQRRVKVWQPDDSTTTCMVCRGSIGRFSRHHCRNCGRLVCAKCSGALATIPSVGFTEAVKVCDDCARQGKGEGAAQK